MRSAAVPAAGRAASRRPRRDGAEPIRSRLAVRHQGEIIFIKAAQVDWIAAEGNYARLHSGESSYLIRESLQSIEATMDRSTFIRVHRSAIVNIDRVRKLATSAEGGATIVLSTGDSVPPGRSYHGRLEEILGSKP